VSTDNHDRPRTAVRVAALPQPSEDVWHPPQQDEPPPPCSQWPRGTAAPHTEGRHQEGGTSRRTSHPILQEVLASSFIKKDWAADQHQEEPVCRAAR